MQLVRAGKLPLPVTNSTFVIDSFWSQDRCPSFGPALGFASGFVLTIKPEHDFNGDGNADILWQNDNGMPAIWFMNGTSLVGGDVLPNPGPSWHVIGTGDFNGDGKADILWQNTDGTQAVWLMNGTSVIDGGGFGGNPGPSWHVIGAGDFDGDGKADMLWQHDSGTPRIWLMDGLNVYKTGVVDNPGPSWHAIGTNDFNGDGMADII